MVGAIIRLGNCFDLLDPKNLEVLREMKGLLERRFEEIGAEMPTNGRHHRNLDCAVFNCFYDESDRKRSIDTARGVYVPTSHSKRIWKGSWLYDETHIQFCVRNQSTILAVWHVQENGRYGKKG